MISLGGAHSNHLHALAAAGKRFGFTTVGLLRGHPQETPTTRDLQDFGMHLHWLGFAGYRARHAPDFWRPWQAQYPQLQAVPEGGASLAGAQGCSPLVKQVREQVAALGWADYDAWWLAAGTGTTLAGLVLAEARAAQGLWRHGGARGPRGGAHGARPVAAGGQPCGYQLIEASRGGFRAGR